MRMTGKTPILAAMLVVPLALTGCGLGKTTGSNVTPKPNVKITNSVNATQTSKTSSTKTTKASANVAKTHKAELYLIDKNGHVAPTYLDLPQTTTVAAQAMKFLVQGGPISDLLPNSFQAVLPPGTTTTLNLEPNGTMVADFSKEFLNYNPKYETQMLQAITWTLTQFKDVKRVQLRVNGKALTQMPADKTTISSEGLTRADGINNELGNVADVTGSQETTVYYLSQATSGKTYYVPVTERIQATSDQDLTAVVNALVNGPTQDTSLMSPFGTDVSLVSAPVVKNGVATLNFNENFYTNAKKKTVNDAAVNVLALSLIGKDGIKKVSIQVQGNAKMTLESGKALTKPVSLPVVNTTGV